MKILCWLGFHAWECIKWGEPFSPKGHDGLSAYERAMMRRRVYHYQCSRCGLERQEEGYLYETM